MEINPLEGNRPKAESLNEISPIQKSRGIFITKREQIKELVEAPLVKACEALWDKNIMTVESSANSKDTQEGFGYIRIDFDSLSEGNKHIGEQYGSVHNDLGQNVLEVRIPIKTSSTIEEVSSSAVTLTDVFEKQSANWVHGVSLEDTLRFFEERYGAKYPQAVTEERERLSQSGAWEDECKRQGRYFDTATQMAYDSEELYRKSQEQV